MTVGVLEQTESLQTTWVWSGDIAEQARSRRLASLASQLATREVAIRVAAVDLDALDDDALATLASRLVA